MQEDKNHISFTAEDIRRYHEGKLTPGQMHELEKAALEDPFLADALEGYVVDEVRVPADIDELKKRLQERVEDKKIIPITRASAPTRWLKVAAMIVAVAGTGLIVYNLGFNAGEKNEIAKNETSQQVNAAPDFKADQQTRDALHDSILNSRDTIAIPAEGDLAGNNKKFHRSEATPAASATENETNASLAHGVKQAPPAKTGVPAPVTQASEEVDKALTGRIAGLETKKEQQEQTLRAKTDSVTVLNKNYYARQSSVKAADQSYGFTAELPAQNNSQAFSKAKREQTLRPQPNIFRGKITDDQNNPLPFANITNNRDNIGTYADAQGNFILTSPDSVMDVQVRSLGFENSNVQLQNGLTVNRVAMKDDNSVAAIVLSDKKVNARMRENSMVLEEPEPADGWTKYDAYLANNLKVPNDYDGTQKQGSEVELSFEVNQLGEPINIRVEKSLCEVCDKEAIRLLREGPKWKRKAKKGKRTSIKIPF